MSLDSSLLLQSDGLQRGGEWEFPTSGWTFLWLQSGEAYLMGHAPTLPVSTGMVVVHGATAALRLRASQLGDLAFRWFRLDPSGIFGVFTLLERLRIDHPNELNPRLPWVLPAGNPAARGFQEITTTCPTGSLQQRARLLELVSGILSPPPFESTTPVGSPRGAGDRLEELMHQLTESELLALSVEEMARRCRCEPRRLLFIYRERYGRSLPGQKRQWLRIKACALLSRPDIDIATVARACGYPQADAFRAWFRRQFGMAPARWRKQRSQPVGVEASRELRPAD